MYQMPNECFPPTGAGQEASQIAQQNFNAWMHVCNQHIQAKQQPTPPLPEDLEDMLWQDAYERGQDRDDPRTVFGYPFK